MSSEVAPVLGNLVFSNLRFAVTQKEKETKKDKRNKFKGRDYQRLIKKAEKRDGKLNEIRERNPEKAEKVEDAIKWERALRRAQGEVVKDNMELLKKGLKRKVKTKEKKKQKWEEREKHIENKKEKRKQKRAENVLKRKSRKKTKE